MAEEGSKPNLSQALLEKESLEKPTCYNMRTIQAPSLWYPFNDQSIENNRDIIMIKVLLVNQYERTRMQSRNVEKVVNHLVTSMKDSDWRVLHSGNINEEYFSIVKRIATDHCAKSNIKNDNNDNYLSFATKFCGSHNQLAPFFDSYCWTALAYWRHKDKKPTLIKQDYEAYVEAFKQLQNEKSLSDFTLRHIEYCVWNEVRKKITDQKKSGNDHCAICAAHATEI